MEEVKIYGIRSSKIINWKENIPEILLESLENNNIKIKEDDIIVVTSKVYSMMHQDAVLLNDIHPSDRAKELGKEADLDPRVVQLIIDQSNNQIYGAVTKAVLAKTKYGLAANAGIDLSNSPESFALLLPKNPKDDAKQLRAFINEKLGIRVAVLIVDSRTVPMRRGTFAISLAVAGINAVVDERGKHDLYGREMTITTRAIADNIATAANLVMGETNEQTPFALVRGVNYQPTEDLQSVDLLMPEDQCLYFAPLLKLIRETQNDD